MPFTNNLLASSRRRPDLLRIPPFQGRYSAPHGVFGEREIYDRKQFRFVDAAKQTQMAKRVIELS